MNILLNVPYSLYVASTKKSYTGPLHFSSMLIKKIATSKHSFTAIVFEKTEPHDQPFFKSRVVKQGKNKWLIFNIWISTARIIEYKKEMNPETRSIIDQIKKAILDVQPDVNFLNGFSALTFLTSQAAHELNIPTVTTHHGLWYKEYMALKRKLIKSSIKYRKEIEMDTVRYADKNIFLSKLSLREFQKHLIKVPKKQLEFVKIPYNPDFVNKAYPAPNKSEKLNIVFVGRWDAVKNHEAYLALAKTAKKKGLPWTFYSVCNIGKYTHYEDIIKEYGKYIKVLPTMSAKELKEVYKMSNLTVVPSHFDVYPGVVTESILQNRPALISKNVGWVDEFMAHGISHWITDFTKPEQVLKKIASISKEQIPKSLYKEVLKVNNPEYVFKKYFQIFEQLKKNSKK